MSKKTVVSISVACAMTVAFQVFALDNTINNEFWNTTAYKNPTPSVENSAPMERFDSGVFDRVESAVMDLFSSVRRGLMLLVR